MDFLKTIAASGLKSDRCKTTNRVATVREKVWKMKFFPGQGKVTDFEFESGKIAKSEKVREKFLRIPQLIKLKSLNILFENYLIFPFYRG